MPSRRPSVLREENEKLERSINLVRLCGISDERKPEERRVP
jgi:hypothetical protein